MATITRISKKRLLRLLEEGAELYSIRRALFAPGVSQNKLVGSEGGLVMLDHVLRGIPPRPMSLAFPDRHFPGFQRREIVADLLDRLLDVLGLSLKIDRHGCRAPNHCAFHCAQKTSKL
ncbi:hypothetical protein QA649_11205 [Bradyrhizobium sp. CB1717]|uniref:hypothetical protein n=1 Tax=Bradyrhizobium sp. CB1717 TaxID=3039154 RepID=UPI0024B18833|nr:hypothetical protein [Bradyrhizobium sp. CB1717]WFU26744.1 hypothetical protein QA649_11205 [Bradyrhizobium sp. CB1717]